MKQEGSGEISASQPCWVSVIWLLYTLPCSSLGLCPPHLTLTPATVNCWHLLSMPSSLMTQLLRCSSFYSAFLFLWTLLWSHLLPRLHQVCPVSTATTGTVDCNKLCTHLPSLFDCELCQVKNSVVFTTESRSPPQRFVHSGHINMCRKNSIVRARLHRSMW